MSNKRIQKKRAKAEWYQKRLDMVAQLAVFLCPGGTKDEIRCTALALWKRDDRYLVSVYWDESRLRQNLLLHRIYDNPFARKEVK